MEKQYEYFYKRYMNEFEDYFSFVISANSKKNAYRKIVFEHNGILGKDENEKYNKAEEFIVKKIGKKWSVALALGRMNPLGSSNTALYRIDKTKKNKAKHKN